MSTPTTTGPLFDPSDLAFEAGEQILGVGVEMIQAYLPYAVGLLAAWLGWKQAVFHMGFSDFKSERYHDKFYGTDHTVKEKYNPRLKIYEGQTKEQRKYVRHVGTRGRRYMD